MSNENIDPGYGIWNFTFSLRLPSGTKWPIWKVCGTGDERPDEEIKPGAVINRLREAEQKLKGAFLGNSNEFEFWGLARSGEMLQSRAAWPRTSPQRPTFSCTLRRTSALHESPDQWLEIRVRRPDPGRSDLLFSNEFFVCKKDDWSGEGHARAPEERLGAAWCAAYNAQFNLAVMLAYRRSRLPVHTLSQRIYHVFLPWGRLRDVSKVGERTVHYVVFPSLTLVRSPDSPCFRRTLSLTLTLAPVSVVPPATAKSDKKKDRLTTRVARSLEMNVKGIGLTEVSEAHRLLGSLHRPAIFLHSRAAQGAYALDDGPLETYLQALGGPRKITFLLRELARTLVYGVALNCTDGDELDEDRKRELMGVVEEAVKISRFAAHVRAVNATKEDLGSWAREADGHSGANQAGEAISNILQEDLKSWTCIPGLLDVHDKPETLRISYGLGLEEPQPAFYVPWEKLVLEVFGNNVAPKDSSHLWVVAWQHMLTTGLSALSEMLGALHREVERQKDVKSLRDRVREYLIDCAEYFDLDFTSYYKGMFHGLKDRVGLREEYERLLEKVKLVNEDQRVAEGDKLNQNILWLTMVAVFVGVAAIVGPYESPVARMGIIALAAVLMSLLAKRVVQFGRRSYLTALTSMAVAVPVGAILLLLRSQVPASKAHLFTPLERNLTIGIAIVGEIFVGIMIHRAPD